jgi:hypothetical protein
MPAYIASALVQQVNALYPGNQLALVNNAATDSSVTKTLQFAIGPQAGQLPRMTFINTTNQDCQIELAASDADANYQVGSGLVAPAGTSFVFNAFGWCRGLFATAPTSGSLIALAG